jgi:MFS family permease
MPSDRAAIRPGSDLPDGARIRIQPRRSRTWHVAGYVYFTFVCYLSIGLPIAVLPPFVHLRMGHSAALAGLVVSIQYVATLASRPWAGRISDGLGAKVSVLWGMTSCAAAGALVCLAAGLGRFPAWSLALLVLSRLALGVGESLGSTGATLWGISAAGPEHTAQVIGMNGISTFGAMALAAPLGVLLDAWLGLGAIGALTLLLCAASLVLASRKEAVLTVPGEHLPFRLVLGRVAPHGMGLALAGVGYSVLATFVTLFFAQRRWSGAALCLTAFGLGFVAVRVLFLRLIGRHGGFKVAVASLLVESAGAALLWLAVAPWMALVGAAVSGVGFSLVFPAIGVEAVNRVPAQSRGTALGVYTAFADVSFFAVGPIAGAIAGSLGYGQVFLFALLSVLAALGVVLALFRAESAQ